VPLVRRGREFEALTAEGELILGFRERHPRMRVQLISMSSRQIAHGLEHGELEAGLTYLDNEPLARVDAVPLSRPTRCPRSSPTPTPAWSRRPRWSARR
jgi:hypothetical protein